MLGDNSGFGPLPVIRGVGSARSQPTLVLERPRKGLRSPGAPDGEYLVIRFAASFEKKQSAIETVTPIKDADGIWRVCGYFIQ